MFSNKLLTEVYQRNSRNNIIYSPFSIQTCLAMIRMGASGESAIELDQVLDFTSQATETVAENFHTMLAKYENSSVLQIANRIYVAKDYELEENYNEILLTKFFSAAENLDFHEIGKTVSIINNWIESKTNNLIRNLAKPGTIPVDTRLFLVSAIHFKGCWEEPFLTENTKERDFYVDEKNTVKLQTMFKSENAAFAKFNDLQATGLRMPYKDSDLSMLIILPTAREGLPTLIGKLKNVQLNTLTSQLKIRGEVDIYLPKFKAELEIELSGILQKVWFECHAKLIYII